jgi:hypothetical protein
MQTFLELQASFEKLYQTLDHINDAQAERKRSRDAMYYKRVGKVASAEFYFGKIPSDGPTALGTRPRPSWHSSQLPRKPQARRSSSHLVHRPVFQCRADGRCHGWYGHGRGWHGHGWYGHARWDDVI